MPEPYPQTDHDLLIRMDENLRNLSGSVSTLSANTAGKIDDLSKRTTRLERWGSIAIGALTLMQVLWQAHVLCGFAACPASSPIQTLLTPVTK